ncbi:LysR family transcriptional regulator [Segnochrobactrum spirostomi]|uniref:LysR family transcriptional regulator n=1 Tax=Segnochrobactrum spirostomi TaxID=2608987 RepID=A0A6A7Y0R0_9HYPH|nr:LysR family transcriptional regulator [Segnochrobactrum spirostomi]MQT12196.1 LysR family transcriptional regulator [Segnochrobactrum spirostomi]
MPDIDLNLLVALEALLAERSVTGAARRLGLSPSAMSRTLARLRRATGDALLVQAGRGLVPTPHAEALGRRVAALAREARAVLGPAGDDLDLPALDRTFTIRAGEGFVDLLGGPLATRLAAVAPRVRLRFVPKADKDARPLREGTIDFEIGVLGTAAPEVMSRLLFRDRSVGIARTGHPLLDGAVTPERYAACRHVVVSREGDAREPADDALAALGLTRAVPLVVPGYPDAMRIVRASDLVSRVPRSCLGNALVTDHASALGLGAFDLPVPTPDFVISAIWHPRLDDDPAHRWLRDFIARLCADAYS